MNKVNTETLIMSVLFTCFSVAIAYYDGQKVVMSNASDEV